jgi:hypothetical protein
MTTKHSVPTAVHGTEVEHVDEPTRMEPHTWHTLIPVDGTDLRVWEWCSHCGMVLRMMGDEP